MINFVFKLFLNNKPLDNDIAQLVDDNIIELLA